MPGSTTTISPLPRGCRSEALALPPAAEGLPEEAELARDGEQQGRGGRRAAVRRPCGLRTGGAHGDNATSPGAAVPEGAAEDAALVYTSRLDIDGGPRPRDRRALSGGGAMSKLVRWSRNLLFCLLGLAAHRVGEPSSRCRSGSCAGSGRRPPSPWRCPTTRDGGTRPARGGHARLHQLPRRAPPGRGLLRGEARRAPGRAEPREAGARADGRVARARDPPRRPAERDDRARHALGDVPRAHRRRRGGADRLLPQPAGRRGGVARDGNPDPRPRRPRHRQVPARGRADRPGAPAP